MMLELFLVAVALGFVTGMIEMIHRTYGRHL